MPAGPSLPGRAASLRLDPLLCRCDSRRRCQPPTDAFGLSRLDRNGVVLRRSVRGMRIAVSVPVSAFLGVAMRIVPPGGRTGGAVAVMLAHRDPGALGAAVRRARRRRCACRMAPMGAHPRPAAPCRRRGGPAARGLRAARRGADRPACRAPPPARRARKASPAHPDAPQAGRARSPRSCIGSARSSRGARVHSALARQAACGRSACRRVPARPA